MNHQQLPEALLHPIHGRPSREIRFPSGTFRHNARAEKESQR